MERSLAFTLEAPVELSKPMRLWATHYHMSDIDPAPAGAVDALPLIGRGGKAISAKLSVRDWCEAALQGSVSIADADGDRSAYVFLDARGPEQANCDQWLGGLSDRIKLATRKARFVKAPHPMGCGARHVPLQPLRTIAVDPDVIPIGSVIFVPALRGRSFVLDGRDYVHDGYLFAGDQGGAVRGAHIDVFTTEDIAVARVLDDLFASTPEKTFVAHRVPKDAEAVKGLTQAQTELCSGVDQAPL
jgi:3D (Asp-Asp-Asp) domain-containing protein